MNRQRFSYIRIQLSFWLFLAKPTMEAPPPPPLFVFLFKSSKKYKKEVDRAGKRCYHAVKIESLDRGAVSISTSRKASAAGEGKGATAEVSGQCLLSGCWVGREHLPDCHKIFCEALSLAVGSDPFEGRFSV